MLTTQEALILSIIVEMMVFGFSLLFYLYKRENISPRIFYLITGVILYISAVSVAISLRFFWNYGYLPSIAVLIIAALYFLIPLKSEKTPVDWRTNSRFTLPVTAVLVLYELTMGFFYGSAFLPHTLNPVVLSIDNIDFSIMMAIDAFFFLAISRKIRTLSELALFTFALSMAFMPNFYFESGKSAILISALLSSTLMVINIVFLYMLQMRKKGFNFQVLSVSLAFSDFLMMAALVFYVFNKDLLFISFTMILSMLAYFFLVTQRLSNRLIKKVKGYSFSLLVLVNAAELAMSLAVTSLGFSISNAIFPGPGSNFGSIFAGLNPGMISGINYNNPLWWLFPFDPAMKGTMAFHMGLSVGVPFAYFWSSFMLIMTTTMSPFYAIMMGSEMSYLVLDRYRTSRNRSVRNWALAIVAGIPLFVIIVPFYTPLFIFGMSGMLYSIPLILFAVSVAAVIVASILFGRRAQCNLMCMAAHMWTNSYYDQFKPSRDHKILWSAVRVISFALMVLSFGIFALQQIGFMGPLKIGMIVINPLDFYGMFVLNYIWWFFYFLTPVFGAYSCARQGWCGFGTLSGIFNKFFFRIQASDISACQTCSTRSCESSCPTSIPVRADVLRKGYSNRISCVGCGDCVEACELENIVSVDFRNYLKKGKKTDKNSI